MKKAKQNENNGFSLIELIIIIAIMGILATGMVSLIGLIRGRQANAIVTDTAAALGKIRVTTMAESAGAAEIADDADYYLQIEVNKTQNCVISQVEAGKTAESITVKAATISSFKVYSASGITAAYTSTSYTDYSPQEGDTFTIRLAYNRSTGAFIPQKTGESSTSDTYIKRIEVSQGTKTFTLVLTPATGKYEVVTGN